MYHMNDIARMTKDAMLIDELKSTVLELVGQPHRTAETLSVFDLFEIALSKAIDLSRSDKVSVLYKQISPEGWIQSGGSSSFTVVMKNGLYSHVAEHSTTLLREARYRGQAGLELLSKLYFSNPEFLELLPPKNRALAVFSLRRMSLTNSFNASMYAPDEPWYSEYLRRMDCYTEKASVDLFDTLYHRQWSSMLKDAMGEEFMLGSAEGMLLVDLYKSRGAVAVMDCLEFRPLFLVSNLVESSILALAQGSINAEQCVDLITNGVRAGLGSNDLQKAMAGKIIRASGRSGHVGFGLKADGSEVHRFWLETLPKAINNSKDSQFSPIHGALHIRYKAEHEALSSTGDRIEALEEAREGVRAYLARSDTARMSAVEYFSSRNDINEAVDLCLEFCSPASLKDNLLSIAKSFTESVTRLRMRSNSFYPFDNALQGEQLASSFNPLFCAQVGHALCEVLNSKSTAPRLLDMPGAMPFIRRMSEQEGWSDERKFDFAKSFRSWPIRKALLEGLHVPSSCFRQLPPGQRRQLISNDFEM